MKDWKKIASGHSLDIPGEQLEKIAPALDSLEAAFRPLVASIPPEIEPAITFRIAEESE